MVHGRLTLLSLCLAASAALAQAPLRPAGWNAAAGRAAQAVVAQAPSFGLPEGSTLRVLDLQVQAEGRAMARVQQVHRGLRVWGALGTLAFDATGRPLSLELAARRAFPENLQPGVDPSRLEVLLARRLPAPLAAPLRPELVLLETTGGPHLRFTQRLEQGQVRHALDLAHSVLSSGPAGPALAWHVRAEVAQGDPEEFLVDAKTGRILDRWPALKSDTPAKGTAQTQYSGAVSLDTTDLGNGTFRLADATRGQSRNPFLGQTGLAVFNLQNAWEWPSGQKLFFEGASNAWGDGQNFDSWSDPFADTTGPTGQTAGADALFGLEAAWDMLHKVFGRNGLDGLDTGVYARVHANRMDATWDPATFSLTLGDAPPNVSGDYMAQPRTMPEVIGHELGHGLVSNSARLLPTGETAGIEESAADVFGTLLKFYMGGANGTGTHIPDTGGTWTYGLQYLNPVAQAYYARHLDLPSRDGISPDSWYHGLGLFDAHYASGVGNRVFYLLSQGAPASGPLQSPYLPAGFAGIGNDKAAAIWFHALTTYTWPDIDYHGQRSVMQHAARDLFGDGSPEEQAVANAYAAVNVGAPWGQAPRPLVLLNSTAGFKDAFSIAVTGVPAKPFAAEVRFAANAAVTWTAPDGGLIQADGTFTAPLRPGWSYRLRATSAQDPLEYAEGLALLVNLDVDDDGSLDATDMGRIAIHYGQGSSGGSDVYPDGWVDDADVQVYVAGFNAAFGR